MRRFADRGPLEVAGYAFTLAIAFLVFSAALGAYLGWDAPLLLGLVIGSAAGVLTAALLIWDYNKLLWKIEEWSQGKVELTGDNVTGKPPVQSPEQQAARKKPGIYAPSGRYILLIDLLRFAKLAPQVETTFRGYWSQQWEHHHWQDVMDIWHERGCVEKHRERHKAKWLAETYEEAWRKLMASYTGHPTP